MAFQGPCQQASCSSVLCSQTTLKCSLVRPHAWKSQSLPWQDSPESRHFKMGQLFSCYGWKPKSMRSAFRQHRLSVSWQDLLMSCRVLQLKLSQEASLRWEHLLGSSKQSRPEKLLLWRKHALLYSFPSFLRLSVDSVIHVWVPFVKGAVGQPSFHPPHS